MATLRYVGNRTISFVNFEAHPGDEFTVPDHLEEAYTRRADVIAVEPDSTPPLRVPVAVATTEPVKVGKAVATATDPVTPVESAQEG